MRILLIGNFAPPYEEENLSNISLLRRLEEEGHRCRVINISVNPSTEAGFVDAKSFPAFLVKLLRLGWRQDVIHFSTKGYLRVGLLKMMASIFAGKFFRARTVLTFHSELFSMLGQMRSPFGGTQTLHTTFFLVDKIIFADKDTYEVASMYRKKTAFELIPPFIHVPGRSAGEDSAIMSKLRDKEKTVVFSNVTYPSFVFELISWIISNRSLPPRTGVVISLSEIISTKLKRALEEAAADLSESLIFVEPHDLESTLAAYSKADIAVRPLSCDGETFFENFAFHVRKIRRSDHTIHYPEGLLFLKEGKTAQTCARLINTLLSSDGELSEEPQSEDSYRKIRNIYEA